MSLVNVQGKGVMTTFWLLGSESGEDETSGKQLAVSNTKTHITSNDVGSKNLPPVRSDP